MNILVIGQTTMQIGRMEFGNIGNYYIIEPFESYITYFQILKLALLYSYLIDFVLMRMLKGYLLKCTMISMA